jgi:cell wall-associated NlpC family hydrolase
MRRIVPPLQRKHGIALGVVCGLGGFSALVAIVALMFVMSIFGVQSGVQGAAGGCQQYEDSINSKDGTGPGQGVYNPVMPAGGMYLPSTAALHEIPPVLMLDAWKAAARYKGYDWTTITGQMYQETRLGQDPSAATGGQNSLGYKGILQFGDPAWTRFGADGDGDGKKDLYDPADAAYAAANYMDTLNIEQQAWKALLGYSGSSATNTEYPRVVLTEAARWRGDFTTDKTVIKKWYDHLIATVKHNPTFPVLGKSNGIPEPVNGNNAQVTNAASIAAAPASSWSTPPLDQAPGSPRQRDITPPSLNQDVSWDQCSGTVKGPRSYLGGPGGPLPPTSSAVLTAVLAWAKTALGTPYVWGAPRLQGDHPTSYDCSSFVQWAWYQGTHGAVHIGDATAAQYPELKQYQVQPGHEQPGDLIFFGFGAALHHVVMVWDPKAGTAIQAPQTGETVDFTRYNNAQHPHVWSDQVGIFRVPVPKGVHVRYPAGTATPGNDSQMSVADPAAAQVGAGTNGRPAAAGPDPLPTVRMNTEEGTR